MNVSDWAILSENIKCLFSSVQNKWISLQLMKERKAKE